MVSSVLEFDKVVNPTENLLFLPLTFLFHLLPLGVAGLAGYIYLDRSSATSAPPKPKISDQSALDSQNFKDFKLKKVEPYNHNTAKYILTSPSPLCLE